MKRISTTLFLLALLSGPMAWGQLAVTPLGSGNAGTLVTTLVGSGVSASNVTYQGIGASAGIFTNGGPVVGLASGIVLSTGSASGVLGSAPVTSSTCNFIPGDPDLALLSGSPVSALSDATVLSFDFVPTFNTVTFRYVFASEEYNQYVGSTYNDVFGFYVNGVNVALIPATTTQVSINNVNDCVNPLYFIDNIGSPQGGTCAVARPPAGLGTAMNGLTTILTVTTAVNPGVTNTIKLAIADVGDCRNDSNVFIEANSFSSAFTPTQTDTPTATETPCGWPGITCTPTLTWTPTWTGTPTHTETPCNWPANTCTPTWTHTYTPTETFTHTSTGTPSPSSTTTVNVRPSNTFTSTHTPTVTHTPTFTFTFTSTSTPTFTLTPCGYPGNTCTFTPTSTPTPTVVYTDSFYVDKNVLNPSVDGSVSIFVGYSTVPGDFSLRIYNSAGEHIQTLDKQYLYAPLNKSYKWDGTNKNGEPCASGVYILHLTEPYARKIKRLLLIR